MAASEIHPSADDLLDSFLPDSIDPSSVDSKAGESKAQELHPPERINVVNIGQDDTLYDGDLESDSDDSTSIPPGSQARIVPEQPLEQEPTPDRIDLAPDKDADSSVQGKKPADLTAETVTTAGVTTTTEIEKEIQTEITQVEVEKKVVTTTSYEFENGEAAQVVTYVEDQYSPERCFATGPGLKKAKEQSTAKFRILTIEPGLLETGNLSVRIMSSENPKVEAEIDVADNGDNSYMVHYTPPTYGTFLIEVLFYGNHIPGSPFQVPVEMIPDASKCRASGYAIDPNSTLMAGQPLEFFIDARMAGVSDLIVIIRGSKEDPKAFISDDGNGVFSIKFQIMNWGEYYANVWYANKHVPGSPFPLIVHAFPNADKVKVYGPGIAEYVMVDQPAEFHIETKDAGLGRLTIRAQGPKDAFKIDATSISAKHHRTLIARYDPTVCGEYVLDVKWEGQLVPGSPFTVQVFDPAAEVEDEEFQGRDRYGYAGSDSEGSDEMSSDDDGTTKEMRRDLNKVRLTEEEALVYASMMQDKMQVPKNRTTRFPFAPQRRADKRYEGVKPEGTVVVEGSKEYVARSMKINKPRKKY